MVRFGKVRPLLGLLAVAAVLAVPGRASAQIQINFSSVEGARIVFPGDSTFSFVDSSISGFDFEVDDVTGVGPPTSAGLFGNIDGTYTIGDVDSTTVAGLTFESAEVTSAGGQLTIFDGANTLTGDLAFFEIFTVSNGGSSGTVTGGGTINLTNVTYGPGGDKNDLLALEAFGGGQVLITFQFTPARTLSSLVSSPGETSYSGSIAPAIPAPPALLLGGIGAVTLMGGQFLRRRFSRVRAA
jgi:hypothetical protein